MTKAEVFFVGDAIPEFKESQHPRDNDGKFTAGSGGGGAAKGPMSSLKPVNNNLAKAALESGFKLGPQHEGLPAFIHPSGLKVVVHPVEGQKSSSKWALHKGGEKYEGKGGDKLAALLKKLSYSMVEKPEHQSTSELSFAEKTKSLKDHGFTFGTETASGAQTFFNYVANLAVKVNPFGNGWSIWHPGEGSANAVMGFGHQEMLKKITEMSGPTGEAPPTEAEQEAFWNPPEKPAEAAAEAPKQTSSPFSTGVEHSLHDKGYTQTETDLGTAIFEKPSNGAKVQYDFTDGKWIAITPGHMAKEGKGLENLNLLLSGKPAVIGPGGVAPWTNTSKPIVTKAEKENQQAQAIKAVAAQEKAKAAQAKKKEWTDKQKALYQKISASKPEATSTERAALSNYSGSAYASWNAALRHHKDPGEYPKAAMEWLKKASIPEDCVLYRGVKHEAAKYLKSLLDEGAVFFEKGFMSTSTDPNFAKNWAGDSGLTLKLNVPKGAKGASLQGISGHTHEAEILFHPKVRCTVKSYDPERGWAEIDIDTSHIK